MGMTKRTFITAFALFSLFFGAGNLVLPPMLGYNAGASWFLVLLGFALSAVVVPILAIYGHARLQGTMMDFARKVSPLFALVYCLIVYAISVALPAPRTASVTYEMSIAPYFDMSPLALSSIYFILVLIFALNRSKILNLIGKYLTPLIIIILLFIICVGLAGDYEPLRASVFDSTLSSGLLEGYQTFDAIGGVVVGGVIVISLGMQGGTFEERRSIIAKGGLLAGIGLLIIYGGLIALGAQYGTEIETDDRTTLLQLLSKNTLGDIGTVFLGVLVSLACFTTAVGIITGTADFFKGLLGDSQTVYQITAVIGCLLGVGMGQLDVHSIIVVAVPALMFIYPITIVLILLNVIPKKYAFAKAFKATVIATIIFSIPDFLSSIGFASTMEPIQSAIPLGSVGLGWLLPAVIVFLIFNIIFKSEMSEI